MGQKSLGLGHRVQEDSAVRFVRDVADVIAIFIIVLGLVIISEKGYQRAREIFDESFVE